MKRACVVLVSILFLPSCVPLSLYRKSLLELKEQKSKVASCEISLADVKNDLAVKNERLKKFRQVDDNGTILWKR